MTNTAPDFDAEKRRRWYAVWLGAVGSFALLGAFLIQAMRENVFQDNSEPIWQIALILSGIWLFFFVSKYVVAYALWYRPYASRLRAVCLSMFAILAVYLCWFGVGNLFIAFRGTIPNFGQSFGRFLEFHGMIYGLPYLTAALVGLCFARKAPDARESF